MCGIRDVGLRAPLSRRRLLLRRGLLPLLLLLAIAIATSPLLAVATGLLKDGLDKLLNKLLLSTGPA